MPEMLVRNLVASEEVFRSRSMTAGVPSLSLTGDRFDHSVKMTPPYGIFLHRMNSLSSISEQESVEDTEHEETSPPRLSADDSSELDESDSAEPDFIRARQQSVVTAATSVSGAPGSPRLPRASPARQEDLISWFSDDNDDAGPALYVRKRTLDSRSWVKRHTLESSSDPVIRTLSLTSTQMSARSDLDLPQFPPASAATAVVEKPRLVDIPPPPSAVVVPMRTSSIRNRLPSSLSSPAVAFYDGVEPADASRGLPLSSTTTCISVIPTSPSETVIEAAAPPPPLPTTPQQRLRHTQIEVSPRRDFLVHSVPAGERPETRGSTIGGQFNDVGSCGDHQGPRGSLLSSVAANIQTWLDHGFEANFLEPGGRPKTMLPVNIPMPPEIVDNLRIHIENFPDVMLTCRSLAFETLRSYSKKVKQLGPSMHDGAHSGSPFEDDADQKRNPFRRAVKYVSRRISALPRIQTPRPFRPQSVHAREPLAAAALVADWTSIKNIFPLGSDYMCESLYAHLVAYNYVKSVCPAGPLWETRPRTPNIGNSQSPVVHEERSRVSNKAASVLGISYGPGAKFDLPPVVHGRCSSLATAKCPTTSQSSSRVNASRDSMDELRLGLIRCIGCLVTTVTTTGAKDRPSPLFTQELLRSLSEIVRCSEEQL